MVQLIILAGATVALVKTASAVHDRVHEWLINRSNDTLGVVKTVNGDKVKSSKPEGWSTEA